MSRARWRSTAFALLLPAVAAAVACGDDGRARLSSRNGGGPDAAGVGGSISGAGGSGDPTSSGTAGTGATAGKQGGPFTFNPSPCADVFADDRLATYELQINSTEWNAL